MTTTTETETRTPAEELRAAVNVLRCEHSHPCQPPNGSLARPGDCEKCGVTYDAADYVDDENLGKQLADLLTILANDMEDGDAVEREVRLDDGRRRKFVFDEFDRVNGSWSSALKLARSIRGEAF